MGADTDRDVERPAVRSHVTRASLTAFALGLVAIPFALLLLLVEDNWGPLSAADKGARDSLHVYALAHPVFVSVMRTLSDSGSALGWQVVLVVVVAYLVIRRLWRLALFAAVTSIGSSLLNTAVKLLVHRERPVVDQPLLTEPGASFPSGHAQAAMVGYGVLLLVFLPVLAGVWRRLAIAVAVLMVLGIGFSRVALAAHYISDVVAGFVLGLAWLAAMTALFSAWRVQRGRSRVQPQEGLAPEQAERLDPTSSKPARTATEPE
ncbi:MAG: phosphatase PAP2 family protein [Actinomycetota bacterium]|nr:phosphatase PAP2 family protein [Actinomycetota bacterium]